MKSSISNNKPENLEKFPKLMIDPTDNMVILVTGLSAEEYTGTIVHMGSYADNRSSYKLGYVGQFSDSVLKDVNKAFSVTIVA